MGVEELVDGKVERMRVRAFEGQGIAMKISFLSCWEFCSTPSTALRKDRIQLLPSTFWIVEQVFLLSSEPSLASTRSPFCSHIPYLSPIGKCQMECSFPPVVLSPRTTLTLPTMKIFQTGRVSVSLKIHLHTLTESWSCQIFMVSVDSKGEANLSILSHPLPSHYLVFYPCR